MYIFVSIYIQPCMDTGFETVKLCIWMHFSYRTVVPRFLNVERRLGVLVLWCLTGLMNNKFRSSLGIAQFFHGRYCHCWIGFTIVNRKLADSDSFRVIFGAAIKVSICSLCTSCPWRAVCISISRTMRYLPLRRVNVNATTNLFPN